MAINNTVKLTGNLGSEAKFIEKEGNSFAVFSLATTDSYKEKDSEEWKEKETVWHDIIVFNPHLIEEVKSLKKGTRIEIVGSLSYKEHTFNDNGKEFKRREAKIIANKLEQAPLVKKDQSKS
jgi:single-strand DNA-binding protein